MKCDSDWPEWFPIPSNPKPSMRVIALLLLTNVAAAEVIAFGNGDNSIEIEFVTLAIQGTQMLLAPTDRLAPGKGCPTEAAFRLGRLITSIRSVDMNYCLLYTSDAADE